MSASTTTPPLPTLDHSSVGRPITRCGVTIFPVFVHGPILDIATGPKSGVVITEQPSAEVPMLVADNPTKDLVLLVAGETVLGGLQNRVLNVSVLLPAKSRVLVPVSCVEHGRWREGGEFRSGGSFATRRVRRAKVATVGDNVRIHDVKTADQGLVWGMVDSELGRLDTVSASGSLSAAEAHIDTDRHLAEAIRELENLGPLPGQCGAVVAHGSRVVSAEVFATTAMLAQHWAALVRGLLLDAPDGKVVGRPSATRALRFLHRVAKSTSTVTAGVGLGSEHHIRTSRLVAQALVVDEVIVHATAFALAA